MYPIAIFCYNRPEHLRNTIESLLKNKEAKDSSLHVFSDAPKSENETEKVEEVRTFVKSITGFKEVRCYFNAENKGLSKNILYGIDQVFAKYNGIIVMEDDLKVTDDFLKFMNQALIKYQNYPSIFSISGYLYPIKIPENYTKDVLLLPRPSSLGWGTWKDKWSNYNNNVPDIELLKKDSDFVKSFNKGGNNSFPMLYKAQKKIINSWAIKWHFALHQNSAFCLFPKISKVAHTGSDGSGTNVTVKTTMYDVEISNKPCSLSSEPEFRDEWYPLMRKYFKVSFIRSLINWYQFGINPFY